MLNASAGLVAQVDDSELFHSLYELKMFMLGISAAVLVVGFLSAYCVARVRILVPIFPFCGVDLARC